jgi:hypothetical protein
MLMIFLHAKAKTFCLVNFLAKNKKRRLQGCKRLFFSRKKAPYTKNFYSRMMKNRHHQRTGKPHTQKKFQGAAIYVEDAMIKIRGLNLCGAHCRTVS